MCKKKLEWPYIFEAMCSAAKSRDFIPFLTEFGGSQDWGNLPAKYGREAAHYSNQIRAYMNLQFVQIEAFLLNSVYWNYDLYNTLRDKDNWNEENFSLLGPNRVGRNLDIVTRPYPMLSSAEPKLLFFDLVSKLAVIILEGKVIEPPTVIYIPFHKHYSPEFYLRATSDRLKWDKTNQMLYWHPNKDKLLNQIIISRSDTLKANLLPKQSSILLDETKFVMEFS